MKTIIFHHRGEFGVCAGDTFINQPTQPGQLGYIVDLNELEISQEAFDMLKDIPKLEDDDVGDVMCWETEDKSLRCFAWIGGPRMMLHPGITADRDYNPELLRQCITDVTVPAAFIHARGILNNLKAAGQI